MTTFVNRSQNHAYAGADGNNGILADSIPSVFAPGYNSSIGSYELCAKPHAGAVPGISTAANIYGITTRICPELGNWLVDTSNLIFPGSGGIRNFNLSWFCEFFKQQSGKKHKYPMRRFGADKFIFYQCYGSQKLNRVPEELDIAGAELKKNGNYMSYNITFGSAGINSFQDAYLYSYTCVNQMIHIRSDGSVKIQR